LGLIECHGICVASVSVSLRIDFLGFVLVLQ
jgi:hypothetical protein